MTKYSPERYAALVKYVIERIETLGTLKGGEYAGDVDRLANFRRNAEQVGSFMEQIWAIYYNKHHDAVMQYVKDKAAGRSRQRAEPLQGRLDDMIVYAILMKAILDEQEPTEAILLESPK